MTYNPIIRIKGRSIPAIRGVYQQEIPIVVSAEEIKANLFWDEAAKRRAIIEQAFQTIGMITCAPKSDN